MGRKKAKHVDKAATSIPPLATTEDQGFFVRSNDSAHLVNSTGARDFDMPSDKLAQFSSVPSVDISPAVISLMNDTPQFNTYQNIILEPEHLTRTGIMPYSNPSATVSAESLQMGMQGTEVNNTRPQLTGSSLRFNGTPMEWDTQYVGGMGDKPNVAFSSVSDCPGKLDARFLTLGVGGNTEARSKPNASRRYAIGENGMVVHPQLNSSYRQQAYISPINHDFNTVPSFHPQLSSSYGQQFYRTLYNHDFNIGRSVSSVQANVGEFPRPEENPGPFSSLALDGNGLSWRTQNGSGLSILEQKVDLSNSGQMQNVGESSSASKGMNGSANRVQNTGASHLFTNNIGVTGGTSPSSTYRLSGMPPALQSDDKYQNFLPNLNTNLGGNRTNIVNLVPNRGFHGFSGSSSVPHVHNRAELAGSGQQRNAALPPLTAFMTRQTAKLNSDQLQKDSTVQSLQSGATMVPPHLGVRGNIISPNQSTAEQNYSTYQSAANQTVESSSLPKRIELPLAVNLGLFQATRGAQTSNNFNIPAYAPGQETAGAMGSNPAYGSNGVVRPPLKRKTSQPLIQIKRAMPENLFSHPCTSNKTQVAAPVALGHTASLPSLNQTGVFLPISSRTASSRTSAGQVARPHPQHTKTNPLPPLARVASPLHIKWKGPEDSKPSEYKCSICKRDLSYTPEGPVFQPTNLPVAAVLPCGHCFHDHCLKRITPEDQATGPPCIPCALVES